MPTRIDDFELGLRRAAGANRYLVETRYLAQGAPGDVRPPSKELTIDLDGLAAERNNAERYGKTLGTMVFGDADVLAAFSAARAATETADAVLHVRLAVDAGAPELHRVQWELARHPADGNLLFQSERIHFSRYLSSRDYGPIRLRARADLRALIAISSPTNLADLHPGERQLAPVDVPAERNRAQLGLGKIVTDPLPNGGRCTSDGIIERVRGGTDILFLVCHGALVGSEPLIVLEKDDGTGDIVRGKDLVARIRELRQRPTLVVLASCQSAGAPGEQSAHDDGALAGLGPRLAEAGIPAVVAMQGNVTMQTSALFTEAFFRELALHGHVSQAMAVARSAIRQRDDWWMPVLFTRLRTGTIWYEPGVRGTPNSEGFKRWPALLDSIRQRACTPVLGPGVLEPYIGTRQELARRLALRNKFPLEPEDRENLPKVCQYLAVELNPGAVPGALLDVRCEAIRENFPEVAKAIPRPQEGPPERLAEYYRDLLAAAWAAQQKHGRVDIHTLLATRFSSRTYLSTNDDDLLQSALTAAGRPPKVEICGWNNDIKPLDDAWPDDADGATPRPLVYHLFGQTRKPESMVLTEDDYFDFLLGVSSRPDLMPAQVRRSLTDTSLVFIGFQLDDWNVRVLFRTMLSQQGSSRRSRYAHIAVQLDPENGQVQEPELIRRYLNQYFGNAKINIFWGSVDDFTKKLSAEL